MQAIAIELILVQGSRIIANSNTFKMPCLFAKNEPNKNQSLFELMPLKRAHRHLCLLLVHTVTDFYIDTIPAITNVPVSRIMCS
jgi:hypothetical protein